MNIQSNAENNGLDFEVKIHGQCYSGLLSIEAIHDHFSLHSYKMEDVESFFKDKKKLLEQEICNALQRHPPMGRQHILILPHHMR